MVAPSEQTPSAESVIATDGEGISFAQMRVADIVTEAPGRAAVLTRFGLEFCCGGHNPLAEACQSAGLDLLEVSDALTKFDEMHAEVGASSLTDMSASEICDLIESKHHQFLKNHLPVVSMHAQKVARVHGQREPHLMKIFQVFESLKRELEPHLMKEERILFPLIRQLESATTLPESHCGSVNNPITAMIYEHENAGSALAKLNELTNGYQPPAHACNTYRALFSELELLERDTHQHIHMENHVLFPKALELEQNLTEI